MKQTRLTLLALLFVLPVLLMVGLPTAVVNLHTPTTPCSAARGSGSPEVQLKN